MKIGILAAMPEEIDLLNSQLAPLAVKNIGNRTYYHGHLFDMPQIDTTLVFSRWGKVAAAAATATLMKSIKYPSQLSARFLIVQIILR